MKVLKRNQIIISVIALMLITVGYLNFGSSFSKVKQTSSVPSDYNVSQIGDARLVNSESTEEIIDNQDELAEAETNENENENVPTSAVVSSSSSNYFLSSRMERDSMYSEMIETYEKLVGNVSVSQEQKQTSTQEIANINNKKNSIMIAENLIKNLGFDDVVIFFSDASVSVIIRADTLQEADVAQIQNIVCRELNVKPEMIHISVK